MGKTSGICYRKAEIRKAVTTGDKLSFAFEKICFGVRQRSDAEPSPVLCWRISETAERKLLSVTCDQFVFHRKLLLSHSDCVTSSGKNTA